MMVTLFNTILKSKKKSHNNQDNSIPTKKRKAENDTQASSKKQRILEPDDNGDDIPPGTQWDGENYSCAYDALFAILYNIWSSKPKKNGKKYSKTAI